MPLHSIPEIYMPVISGIIQREGLYSNDPTDRGGETKYGITAKVWRSYGFLGQIKDAPIDMAEFIYFDRYIHTPRFDAIATVNQLIGNELIDTGVNMGPGTASIMLQRWLNALSGKSADLLFVDGRIGQITIEALRNYILERGDRGITNLLKGLNGLQANNYLEITERDKSQRRFIYGWLDARVN